MHNVCVPFGTHKVILINQSSFTTICIADEKGQGFTISNLLLKTNLCQLPAFVESIMQTTILILAFAVAAVVAQPTASNVTKTTAPIASNVTKNTAPAAPIANNSSLPSPLASNSTTSSAPAPTPAPKSCYTNMTEVSASVLAKDPFVVKKYILCPNTLFKIGFPSSDTAGAFNDGFAPVQLRSNTQILCGEDGSSANNCTVDGGQVQLLNTPNPLTMETNDNMLVQGLTFQNGGNAGAIFAQAGKNITLRDCIFKVSYRIQNAYEALSSFLAIEIPR